MPTAYRSAYITGLGHYLPGEPISNDEMDAYVAPLNRASQRIKQRILAENGIHTRHYAIDPGGETRESHAHLAAQAIRACLSSASSALDTVSLLAVGSSGGDALMPGFANMIQGELGAPPMQTLSSQGICVAGVSALEFAAQAVELGSHSQALAVGVELPSRLFKHSRFGPSGYNIDFDAHFLRWMLSDGAGACLVSHAPAAIGSSGLALQLKWTHQKSFSGDYPVCMQLGLTHDRSKSFLDFATSAEAEAAGALSLRQDIRLLPHVFDVGIHEYVKLAHEGWIAPGQVDHFLCHYSSAKFAPVIDDLLEKAGLRIPQERWYSNLSTRGNTGAASIFVMLAEWFATRAPKAGDTVLCFIPESGRMTAAFMCFEVVPAHGALAKPSAPKATVAPPPQLLPETFAAPHAADSGGDVLRPVLTALASAWQDYRSRVWRAPVMQQLVHGRFNTEAYQRWTANWVPQVREGSKWMREGAASLDSRFIPLAALIGQHAGEEQNDFQILYEDYLAAGGQMPIDQLKRNPGGEALNAYLHGLAATPNPLGLLGAIYIIEGTGQRIVPALLPLLRAQVDLPASAFRFLAYHGANDEHHLERWLQAVKMVLEIEPSAADKIVQTARHTAQLYALQFESI
ncbi:StlD/DarB family beta-ketosynthase [Ottowia thiooxydans]|uniref:StlD/DarB family beta-ketosynthase n=1 Tax=Ottowia thiooxydans TaxID=219182 RepID=UPI0003F716FD|nr:StlD/DarB family beta-ketosynthase [Ottowia thiooxydans]